MHVGRRNQVPGAVAPRTRRGPRGDRERIESGSRAAPAWPGLTKHQPPDVVNCGGCVFQSWAMLHVIFGETPAEQQKAHALPRFSTFRTGASVGRRERSQPERPPRKEGERRPRGVSVAKRERARSEAKGREDRSEARTAPVPTTEGRSRAKSGGAGLFVAERCN